MKIVFQTDGLVEYIPHFIHSSESKKLFEQLATEISWQSDTLTIFGKNIITKRKVAWYGDDAYEYIYSNNNKIAKPWTTSLKQIKHQLEHQIGETFNSCLLNYYHDGTEGMGWHSDDEVMMKRNATIASISLGAERTFIFRHKQTKEQHAIELQNGSLLLMKGATQKFWKHQLPIRKRIKSPRINLTFRKFITDTTTSNNYFNE